MTSASYGCLCLLIVVAISQDDSNIVQGARYNLGVFNGTLFGIFVLGLFFPWSNRLGAYAGGILGFAFSLWVSISTQMTKRPFTPRAPYSVDGCQTTYGDSTLSLNVTTEVPAYTSLATTQSIYNSSSVPGFSEKRDDVFPLFQIAFMWIPLLAAGSVVIIGAVTSLLTGPTKLECLDLRLLSPVIQNLVKKYLNRKGISTEPSSTEPKGEALRLESRLQTPVFYIAAATENEDRL